LKPFSSKDEIPSFAAAAPCNFRQGFSNLRRKAGTNGFEISKHSSVFVVPV